MHFTEDLPSGNYIINEYTNNSVTINRKCYKNSIYISPNVLVEDLDIQSSDQITSDSVQFIIDTSPEIVILGTGSHLIFPHPSLITHFADHNIGFEAMDHSAACRTYAVLLAEQRDVGALLLINSG